MTRYGMLQTLLSDTAFMQALIDHLNCDKVELLLNEYDGNEYLLDVKVIDVFGNTELAMYTESFDFRLDDRGSIAAFYIKFNDRVSVKDALESAELGKLIEHYLKSELN